MGSEAVRQTWRTVLDTVAAGEDVIVERHAKPTVAIIAYEDYAAMRDLLDEVRSARAAAEIRDAVRSGKMDTVSWVQLKTELKAEGLLDG